MSVLLFLAVLFVLVLVHELGHFFVARKTGMRVDEFGIGFPPRIGGWKKGETLYSINAIPLGGFVKIFGEDQDEGAEQSTRAFSRRPLWAQALVLVAGVTANVLLAWILFSVVFAVGQKITVDERVAGPDAQLTILSVLPDSPASRAGLEAGDEVVGVMSGDHTSPTLMPSDVVPFIDAHDEVTFSIRDGAEEDTVLLKGETGFAVAPERRIVGVTLGLVEVKKESIPAAIMHGAKQTVDGLVAITVGIAGLLYDALFLNADLSGVAGPVGIAGLVGEAADVGLSPLLMFVAFISLNLAVINLLPFPALDGGRLLFVIIEAIKGSPLPRSFAQGANALGFILLMLLMVAVTYNDIARLL